MLNINNSHKLKCWKLHCRSKGKVIPWQSTKPWRCIVGVEVQLPAFLTLELDEGA